MSNPGRRFAPEISDEEEADIQAEIAADPDSAEATDEQLSKARPFAEVFPELAKNFKRNRGRPPVERPKRQISIRLDQDVIDKFRATGKGWQGRINDVLRKAKIG